MSEFTLADLAKISGQNETRVQLELERLGIKNKRSFDSADITALRRRLNLLSGGTRGGGGAASRNPAPGNIRSEAR